MNVTVTAVSRIDCTKISDRM